MSMRENPREGGSVYLWDHNDRLVGTVRNLREVYNEGWTFTVHLSLMHGDYEMPATIGLDGRGWTDSGHNKVATFIRSEVEWPEFVRKENND